MDFWLVEYQNTRCYRKGLGVKNNNAKVQFTIIFYKLQKMKTHSRI